MASFVARPRSAISSVGAVEGAQRNGAVHHELHVGRARGLLAGRGDLLRDLGGWVDELSVAHTEVGDKADLHDLVDAGVVVDDVGNGVNEADGLLGKGVARGSLAAKDEGRRRHVEVRIGDATVVDVHHLHDVHELALIGVEALYLDIEDGVGVNNQTGLGLDVGGQTLLVGALGGTNGLQELGVVLETFKLLQLIGVLEPAIANGLGHELGIGGVGLGKEATVRDAVGLVVELLGRQGIEVLEHDVLDDVRVDLGNAVDAVAADHRQVGHANLAVPQDGGLAQTLLPASFVVSNDSCQRRLISSMIWYTRGRSLENVPIGHFSKASGRMVWLV